MVLEDGMSKCTVHVAKDFVIYHPRVEGKGAREREGEKEV
jgi:hypothetical protein